MPREQPVTPRVKLHRRLTLAAFLTGTAVPVGSRAPLRGNLNAGVEPAAGERLTVLADRGRFARPQLPEDVDPAVPAAFVLGGAGIIGVTVLRFGYPLRRLSSG